MDIEPQKRYIGEHFILADALDVLYALAHGDCWPDQCSPPHDWHLEDLDAIHASPPCQWASRATAWRGNRQTHPNLIPATRSVLDSLDKIPYIIENVQEARLHLVSPIMLCGTMFGENYQSHRYFEVAYFTGVFYSPATCHHSVNNVSRDHGKKYPESTLRNSLGVHWMTVHEARQAIPPVYTHFIGSQLRTYLEATTNPAAPAVPSKR